MTPRISRQVLTAALVLLSMTYSPAWAGFNINREVGNCLSGGCDVVWHLNKRFDDGISSKFNAASQPVKQAFEEAADHIFKTDLDPFLDKVGSLLNAQEDRIVQIFGDALTAVEHGTTRIVNEIKDNIIDRTSKNLREVEDNALADVKCGSRSISSDLQMLIDTNLRIFGSLRDRLGSFISGCPVLDRSNAYSVYNNGMCLFDQRIAHAGTVGELTNAYLEFLSFNSQTQCTILDRGDVLAEIKSQYVSYAKRLRLWNLALQ